MTDFVSSFTPEEELGKIATWDVRKKEDALAMLRFVHARFRGEWKHKDGGTRHRIIPEWSGDEDLVQAMKRNRYWWAMSFRDCIAGIVYVLDLDWMEE